MYSVNRIHRVMQALLPFLLSLAVLVSFSYPQSAKSFETGTSISSTASVSTDPTLTPTTVWLPKAVENQDAESKDFEGMKPYSEKIGDTEVKFEMMPIPGGTFTMGSPESEADRKDDEGPRHEVKIEPFWMGKYEVTWQEYELWGMGLDFERRKAKEQTKNGYDKLADAIARPTKPYSDMSFGMGKAGYPALCMTQFAAKMYCKWLSAKTGHYYRLPTEAEWEYACRAGTSTAYFFGNDPEKLDDYAWHEGNSDDKYHKVGKKKPNPWGLYDMHGNVVEWCLDQYVVDAYKQGDGKLLESPLVMSVKSYPHVVRGGSWLDGAELLRSAARRGSNKEWKVQDPQFPQSIWYFTDAEFLGFRIVRPLRTPTAEEAAGYEITEVEKKALNDYLKAQAGKQ
jgi:formylglycine-generating enzyme required for sulfatase activity